MASLIQRSWSSHLLAYEIMRARYIAQSGIDYVLSTCDLAAFEGAGAVTVDMGDDEQFEVTVTLTNDTYRIRSIGSTQMGSSREMHRVQVLGALPSSYAPPAVVEGEVESVVDDFNENMENWVVTETHNDNAGFELVMNPTSGNADFVVATDMNMSFMGYDPDGSFHLIGHQILYFTNKKKTFYEAWKKNSRHLSYEAQVKMGWYSDREYGAQGIAFMTERGNGRDTSGYYVSLMRYNNENEILWDLFSPGYDGIPNSIKPPGLKNQCLLVVWKQEMSGKRAWLAYKDLTELGDWITDVTGSIGQGFADFVTLNVRVTESIVCDKKYSFIQVMRADPKKTNRKSNNVAEDINEKRRFYPHGLGVKFPKWSPFDFDEWHRKNDYFSLSRTIAGLNIDWDGVNPNEHVAILSDGGTIRTEDFPTPNEEKWNSERYEIGLHVTGYFDDGGSFYNIGEMYFDEFAVRFLKNKHPKGINYLNE